MKNAIIISDTEQPSLSQIGSRIAAFIVENKVMPVEMLMGAVNFYKLFGVMQQVTDPSGAQFRTLFDIPVTIAELIDEE